MPIVNSLGVPVEDLFTSNGRSKERAGPLGRARRAFEQVSKLPRSQQQHLLKVVEAFVEGVKPEKGMTGRWGLQGAKKTGEHARQEQVSQHIMDCKTKAEGKKWGRRKPGTRVWLTLEKETLVKQLHGQGTAAAAIARMVGLTRKTIYRALRMVG